MLINKENRTATASRNESVVVQFCLQMGSIISTKRKRLSVNTQSPRIIGRLTITISPQARQRQNNQEVGETQLLSMTKLQRTETMKVVRKQWNMVAVNQEARVLRYSSL